MRGEQELEAVVRTTAAALAGGLNLPEALAAAAQVARPPVAAPFRKAVAACRCGALLPDALAVLRGHCPAREADLFARALQLGLGCGGGLPRLLTGLALVLQRRRQLRSEWNARCTEARWTAVLMAAMPILLAGYLLWVDPFLLAPLWRLPVGRMALGYAIASWGLGTGLLLYLLRLPELR